MARLSYQQVRDHVNRHNRSSYFGRTSIIGTPTLICLIWAESAFDTDARGSGTTATGLMQMTVAAVDAVNRNTDAQTHYEHSQMTDPVQNIQCGTLYMGLLIREHGNLARALLHFRGNSPATAQYIRNITACRDCLRERLPSVPPADQDRVRMECLQGIHH